MSHEKGEQFSLIRAKLGSVPNCAVLHSLGVTMGFKLPLLLLLLLFVQLFFIF